MQSIDVRAAVRKVSVLWLNVFLEGDQLRIVLLDGGENTNGMADACKNRSPNQAYYIYCRCFNARFCAINYCINVTIELQ